LPLEEVYRPLETPQLSLHAEGRIYRNTGAMPPGRTEEPVAGRALANMASLLDALRPERSRGQPVRRVDSEKQHSPKQRPRGVPPGSEKLGQAVLRRSLAAYYAPQLSDSAHGCRPQRGWQTALRESSPRWVGPQGVSAGDSAACCDRWTPAVCLSLWREKIHDKRFLRGREK